MCAFYWPLFIAQASVKIYRQRAIRSSTMLEMNFLRTTFASVALYLYLCVPGRSFNHILYAGVAVQGGRQRALVAVVVSQLSVIKIRCDN